VVAVAREIESRTIYVVVSKPVSRSSFLMGKFLGAAAVLGMVHLLLAIPLLGVLRLSGETVPNGFLACCTLIFLENLIVLTFAVLVSIPFSSVMAAGLTIAFFLIGRSSTSLEAMASRGASAEVKMLAKGLYFLFPNLERFNLRDVVAYGQPFPPEMLPIGFIYAIAYSAVCLVIAATIFSRRDLP
jgi:ABC-type transport system involved in multi-copper enzyme maturation permease subunit